MIASHRENPLEIAYVEIMVEAMLTTPDGMFNKALSMESNPKPLIRIAENVVMTPLGIVMRIVKITNIHV